VPAQSTGVVRFGEPGASARKDDDEDRVGLPVEEEDAASGVLRPAKRHNGWLRRH